MTVEQKRKREQKVVGEMIQLYCAHNHMDRFIGTSKSLCRECDDLVKYATLRSEKCPFMKEKTFCSNCKVHCYSKEKREKIRKVMRYSGPRILFYHPAMAIWHVATSMREKRIQKKTC
ncbi:MAG: nitrous oxide-stimulated promoter family protein [Clostridiales bacterium]|nr:nitrous oxide-stimulated promoter family protein [Clostridiales bacterium]